MQPLEHLVARMDAMTCRSSRTCSTCEHADRFGGCRLEDAIGEALAPPRRPQGTRVAFMTTHWDVARRQASVMAEA